MEKAFAFSKTSSTTNLPRIIMIGPGEYLAIKDLLASCPNVYTLPGTWSKCNAIIPHYNANPNITFGISIAVITILLAAFGIYKGFFANKGLADPWDDHDD